MNNIIFVPYRNPRGAVYRADVTTKNDDHICSWGIEPPDTYPKDAHYLAALYVPGDYEEYYGLTMSIGPKKPGQRKIERLKKQALKLFEKALAAGAIDKNTGKITDFSVFYQPFIDAGYRLY